MSLLKTTQIIKDPAVEDYFVTLRPEPSFGRYYQKHGDRFAEWFETGKVVVMDQAPIDPDYDLLWKVVFPYGKRSLKKIKSDEITKPIKNKKHALIRIFGDDVELARRFRQEVIRIDGLLFAAAAALFPGYRFLLEGSKITWRLSVTHTEGLHFDVYAGIEPGHVLRIFLNIDSFPRVWCLGDRVETVLAKRTLDKTWGNDANAWNKRITKEYGGDTFGVEPSPSPQHVVMFAPGSMWIVHSQYVSHGPLFGRRMVAVSMDVDPETMQTPDLLFANMPARLRGAIQ